MQDKMKDDSQIIEPSDEEIKSDVTTTESFDDFGDELMKGFTNLLLSGTETSAAEKLPGR